MTMIPLLLFVLAVAAWSAPVGSNQESKSPNGRVVATCHDARGHRAHARRPGRAARAARRHRPREDDDRWRRAGGRSRMCRPAAMSSGPSRPGFVSKDSAAFDVRADEVAQVLLDIQLTFVMPAIEVRAETPSPTDSVQPVSMSDMLAGSVFESRRSRATTFRACCRSCRASCAGPMAGCASKAASPRQGALQISSASLIDPSIRRFRSRPAGAERRVGRSARQPVRRRIRPLLDQRHADSHPARHQRLGDQAGQSHAALPQGVSRGIRGFEPRFSVRGPLKRDRVFIAQDFQFRYVATPVKSLPASRRSSCRASIRSRASTPSSRRGTRSAAA